MLKLLFLIVAFSIIFAQSDNKPLPDFCFGFSGTFLRNTTEVVGSSHFSRHEVKFNPNEKTAFASITSLEDDDLLDDEGLFWLIEHPPGGPSNFFGDNIFVLFQQINETNGDLYCSYSSYFSLGPASNPPGTFPPEWKKVEGSLNLENWFSFPSTLEYHGIHEFRGIEVDLWEDTRYCTLFGDYSLPCFSVATRVDQAVPVFVERAHQKRHGSFEEDWIQRDEWESFQPSTPTITLPTSWSTTCYNTDNGIDIHPARAYVATPSGCDTLTVTLTAPPSAGNSVLIHFVPVTGCTYCAQFETAGGSPLPELTFTEYDWNVPQTVFVCYLAAGEVEYMMVALGGGYEIQNWETGAPVEGTASRTIRILTCEGGVPGYGC